MYGRVVSRNPSPGGGRFGNTLFLHRLHVFFRTVVNRSKGGRESRILLVLFLRNYFPNAFGDRARYENVLSEVIIPIYASSIVFRTNNHRRAAARLDYGACYTA